MAALFVLVWCFLTLSPSVSLADSYGYGYPRSYGYPYFQENADAPIVSLDLDSDPKHRLNSAFRIAARERRVDDMLRLLDEGAEINSQSGQGRTALMNASQYCSLSVVDELLNHHADVNLVDQKNRTALIYAVKVHCLPVVAMLLKAPRISVRARDSTGETALTYAGYNGQIAELIQNHLGHRVRSQKMGY